MRKSSRGRFGAVAVAFCAVTLFVAPKHAQGAPVMTLVSGDAHVHTFDIIAPHDQDKTATITLGTGSLDLTGPSQETAAMQWNLSASDTSAQMAIAFQAFGGIGSSGDADANIHFRVDQPVNYTLTLNFPLQYGSRSAGSIDGAELSFFSQITNPDQPGVKQSTGTLAAGEHVFLASSFAGQGRSNPMRSDGSVTLSIVAIPLPAAFGPGAAVLGLAAWWSWRQHARRQRSCS